ncbi:MAG: hypothetical protein Q8891_13380 [Bacteroidota bacterium]|nr:hypothetical protein [Bacteroidota bacterium]
MQHFKITLKNDRIKSYRIMALIILLLNMAIFIFLLFFDAFRYVASSAILLVGIYIFMRLYFIKKTKQGNYLDEVIFFVLAGCWMGLQNYWIFVILIGMGILYHLALQHLKIVFSSEKVVKTNFPKKEFEWNMFSNVVLKDNILTLDFKNNKLWQAEIEKSQDINEIQFNSFAQSQIAN